MNIDVLSRFIEATDVSTFRSIVAKLLLPLIGLRDADYCDGPYDGGKDFSLATMPATGIRIGIQISVEKKWEPKIRNDAVKLKKNFNTNTMYFISSRRIPEGSYEKIKEEIFSQSGITINKYDNQAIASRLIENNKINEVFILMGIEEPVFSKKQQEYLSPKNEAVSSLLLFDENTKDLRQRFFKAIIMAVLSRSQDGLSRQDLFDKIEESFDIEKNQLVQINSNIDSLLQTRKITTYGNMIKLSENEKNKFLGLRKTTELELESLKSEFKIKITSLSEDIDFNTQNLLINNFLDLTIYLSGKSYSTYDNELKKNEKYKIIQEIISSRFGINKASKIFRELSEFFAASAFTKHIACAKLYDAFLNTKSSHLINALGGTESLNVYIDSSVFIPVVCGLLFEKVGNRSSQSAASLYNLIKTHKFNAIVPYDYMEEVASHIIEACRDYKHIIEEDIDLSHSENAFVSHYSNYKKKNPDINFEEYVMVFNIRLKDISPDMPDSTFFSIRDKVTRELSSIASRYSFSTEKLTVDYLDKKIEAYKDFICNAGIERPDVLIRHDARVIEYLSGYYIPSKIVKLLCTWDKVHSMKNPDGKDGYYVMHPVAVIDYFSLAKGDGDSSVSHLLDFAMMQEEADLELSSKIWDIIARIENENLSDGQIFISAKKFKEQYMEKHANDERMAGSQVEKEWLAWRK